MQNCDKLISLERTTGTLVGIHLDRKEAVAFLKELGDRELVQSIMVIIQQRPLDKCQLEIKGEYDPKQIEIFLKGRGFSYEENKDYLIVSKP